MDVLLTMCVFVMAARAYRTYRTYRTAWVVGQWLTLAQAVLLLTMR